MIPHFNLEAELIINRLALENFGIYGGKFVIDLTPRTNDVFNRPIILFIGKNGVGKTTFVEAIRLCLQGSLALSNRVSQAEYEQYLIGRMHRALNSSAIANETSLEVQFEYIEPHRKVEYVVKRQWGLVRKHIYHEVKIFEDGKEIDLPIDQKENLLRELIPPPAVDLFFFDGEKLQNFIREITNNLVLANTVKSFLGLNIVDQLQKDLDIFISRQDLNNGTSDLQLELKQLSHEIQKTEETLAEIMDQQSMVQTEIIQVSDLIARQEQKIANEGGWYAKHFNEIQAEKQHLALQIELTKHQIQEMCSGLLPFSIAPELLKGVGIRIQKEGRLQKQKVVQEILDQQARLLKQDIEQSEFWRELSVSDETRVNILMRVQTIINTTIGKPSPSLSELVFELSEREQTILSSWIEGALNNVPQRFSELIEQLIGLDDDYRKVEHQALLTPTEENLRPLVDELSEYIKQYGPLEQQALDLAERHDQIQKKIHFLQTKLRQVRESIAHVEKYNARILLASKAQRVLEEYDLALTREKVRLLETNLAEKFNALCRKKSIIDMVQIDPESFSVTLFRKEKPFNSDELSAGEKQLFAIAMIWALHSLSGLPIPVIIDTPLARLDLEHRDSMLNKYLPRASHQVIVLATDAEVNEEILMELTANLSHSYLLEYNDTIGNTTLSELNP